MASRVKLVTRLGLLGPAQPMWAELDPAQKIIIIIIIIIK
jgi:hypothetical protein